MHNIRPLGHWSNWRILSFMSSRIPFFPLLLPLFPVPVLLHVLLPVLHPPVQPQDVAVFRGDEMLLHLQKHIPRCLSILPSSSVFLLLLFLLHPQDSPSIGWGQEQASPESSSWHPLWSPQCSWQDPATLAAGEWQEQPGRTGAERGGHSLASWHNSVLTDCWTLVLFFMETMSW